MEDIFPLSRGMIGGSYRVETIELPAATEQRLESLGMTKGTLVAVQNAKSRGVLVVKVRGTRFALGRGITENIEVRCADE